MKRFLRISFLFVGALTVAVAAPPTATAEPQTPLPGNLPGWPEP
jgi:hypothetical protein